jgi:hypothetical protein
MGCQKSGSEEVTNGLSPLAGLLPAQWAGYPSAPARCGTRALNAPENTMTTERANAGYRLPIQWLLANAAGVAAGLASAKAFGHFDYSCLGIIPGVLQWLLLRRKVAGMGWWAVLSSVGLAAGFFLAMLPMNMAGVDGPRVAPLFALGFALMGAVPGTLQWLLLRRRVSRAGWWVLASSVGMVGCGMTFMRLTRGADVNVVLGGAAGGAVYGAVTGAVIHVLLRFYRRDDDPAA